MKPNRTYVLPLKKSYTGCISQIIFAIYSSNKKVVSGKKKTEDIISPPLNSLLHKVSAEKKEAKLEQEEFVVLYSSARLTAVMLDQPFSLDFTASIFEELKIAVPDTPLLKLVREDLDYATLTLINQYHISFGTDEFFISLRQFLDKTMNATGQMLKTKVAAAINQSAKNRTKAAKKRVKKA